MKSLFTLFAAILLLQLTYAQETPSSKFTMDGEFRTRAEYANGYKILPTENSIPGIFVGQRSRINLNYSNKEMEIKVSFQDVAVWGSDDIINATGMFGKTNSVMVYEAWGKYKMTENLGLKIGRQELVYGNSRILSNRKWANTGISYDEAVLQFEKNGMQFDFGFGVNNDMELTKAAEFDQAKMKTLNFLYFKKKLNDQLSIELIDVAAGFQPNGKVNVIQVKNTLGLTLDYNSSNLFGTIEAYYQNGKTLNSMTVSANSINIMAGYKLGNLNLSVSMDYLSGQNPDETEKYQSFDLFYGARYKYYGNLNYFTAASSTKNGGLINLYANATYSKDKNELSATFHQFQLAQDVADATGTLYDKNLGSEIDIILTRKLAKGIALKVGYSTAMPSNTLEIFKGVGADNSVTPSWGWVMFAFKPQFMSISK